MTATTSITETFGEILWKQAREAEAEVASLPLENALRLTGEEKISYLICAIAARKRLINDTRMGAETLRALTKIYKVGTPEHDAASKHLEAYDSFVTFMDGVQKMFEAIIRAEKISTN